MGSPDGVAVNTFLEGETPDHSELGDELADVAISEGWIEPTDDDPEDTSSGEGNDDIDPKLLEAIKSLDPDVEGNFNSNGKPELAVLSEAIGRKVKGKERDAAWQQVQNDSQSQE